MEEMKKKSLGWWETKQRLCELCETTAYIPINFY